MKTKTDKEIMDWICNEFERARMLSPKDASFVRRRAKLIFDKRFPNPDTCFVCGHVTPVRSLYHRIKDMEGVACGN